MSAPANILSTLQSDVAAILAATPALADAGIHVNDEGDIEARVRQSLAAISGGPTEKRGLVLVVLPPEITEAEANLPGPQFQIRLEIQAIEHYLANRDENSGTLISSDAACLHALGSLHHQSIGALTLYAEKDPVAPMKMPTGYGSHVATLYARSGLAPTDRVATPDVQETTVYPPLVISGTGIAAVDIIVVPTESYNGYPAWCEGGENIAEILGEIPFTAVYWETGEWRVVRHVPDFPPAYQASAPYTAPSPVGLEYTPLNEGQLPAVVSASGPLVISGVSEPTVINGTIPEVNPSFGRRRWQRVAAGATTTISFNDAGEPTWVIEFDDGEIIAGYYAEEDVATPDQVENWTPNDAVGYPTLGLTIPENQSLLTLTTTTPGASIYYTTDGSYPAAANDSASLYTGPIPASNGTYRAAAYSENLNPSNTLHFTVTDDE